MRRYNIPSNNTNIVGTIADLRPRQWQGQRPTSPEDKVFHSVRCRHIIIATTFNASCEAYYLIGFACHKRDVSNSVIKGDGTILCDHTHRPPKTLSFPLIGDDILVIFRQAKKDSRK